MRGDLGHGRIVSGAPGRLAVIAWTALVGFYFFRNWHPVTLIKNQTPVIPQDTLASMAAIWRGGLPDMLSLVMIAFAAYGLGSLLYSSFMPRTGSGGAVFSLGLGIAALSLVTLFIGLAGTFNEAGRKILLGALAISCVYGLARAVLRLKARSWGGKDRYRLAFAVLLSVVSLFLFAKALKPAFFFDAVSCHLAIPNYYIHEGKIGYVPYDSYTNYPLMAEMFYTLGYFVFGLKAAQLSSVLLFIAATITVYSFSGRFIEGLNPAVPAAFFLLTPAFIENAVLYTNDLYLTYFFLLALYALFLWKEERQPAALVLMGIFAGVCLGTKYVALLYVWILFAVAAYVIFRDRKTGAAAGFGALLLSAIAAAALFSPWLVKDAVFTGNPVYPALYGVFGGRDMDPEIYARILASAHHTSLQDVVTGLYRHPWEMSLSRPGKITQVYGASAILGPAFLLFIPAAFIAGDIPRTVKRLGLLLLLLFLIWDASFTQTRYIYPGIVLAAIISAYGMHRAIGQSSGYRRYAAIGVAAFCLFFNLDRAFYQVDTWSSAFGFEHMGETDDEFLARKARMKTGGYLGGVEAYAYANKNIARDARVLIIGDYQHLYMDRRYVYCCGSKSTPYDVFVEKAGQDDEITAHLKGAGITHIIYNPAEMRRLQALGNINFRESDDRHIEDYLSTDKVRLVMSSRMPAGPVYLFEVL